MAIIELRNIPGIPEPQGFSHASIAPSGRIVHLAGQIGTDATGALVEGGLAEQTEQALRNVVAALAAADATPADLAKVTMYVTGWTEARQRELFAGIVAAAQANPLPLVPITLIGCEALFLDAALIEIEATAVLPD